MYQESEILTLVLSSLILIFILFYKSHTKIIPYSHYFLSAYFILLLAYFCTVLESFLWYSFFHYTEHISYALSFILLSIWGVKKTRSKRKGQK